MFDKVLRCCPRGEGTGLTLGAGAGAVAEGEVVVATTTSALGGCCLVGVTAAAIPLLSSYTEERTRLPELPLEIGLGESRDIDRIPRMSAGRGAGTGTGPFCGHCGCCHATQHTVSIGSGTRIEGLLKRRR